MFFKNKLYISTESKHFSLTLLKTAKLYASHMYVGPDLLRYLAKFSSPICSWSTPFKTAVLQAAGKETM